MYLVTKTMFTETAHRLIDYPGLCSHIHGHSYRWEVTLGGTDVDKRGMVADFKDLKGMMKEVIGPYDHSFIICDRDPLCVMFPDKRELKKVLCSTMGKDPRLFIYEWNPTAENLAKHVYDRINTLYKESFHSNSLQVFKVVVRETETSYAEWI